MPWKPLLTPSAPGLSRADRSIIDDARRKAKLVPRWGTDDPVPVLCYIDYIWYLTEKYGIHQERHDQRNSEHWQWLRKEAYKRSGGCCERCGLRGENRYGNPLRILNLHHLTYERLGHELLEDVELICHECHEKDHGVDPLGERAF